MINPLLRFSGLLANPENSVPLSDETRSKCAGRLPDWLLSTWRNYGIGTYRNGYFSFCLPQEFDGVLAEIFAWFTDLSAEDFAVFGYTSDSILYVINRTGEMHWIYMNFSYIISFRADDDNDALPSGVAPGIMAATKWISDDLHTHNMAVKSLGLLNKGEVFGYLPALQLGGFQALSNIRKMRAAEHWFFLAQLQPFRF